MQKNTLPSVKHGCRTLIICRFFVTSGPRKHIRVHRIIKKKYYLEIIPNKVNQSVQKLPLGKRLICKEDNDSKNVPHIIKEYFTNSKLNVLKSYLIHAK